MSAFRGAVHFGILNLVVSVIFGTLNLVVSWILGVLNLVVSQVLGVLNLVDKEFFYKFAYYINVLWRQR